jgi:hypothetical protein
MFTTIPLIHRTLRRKPPMLLIDILRVLLILRSQIFTFCKRDY